MPPADRNGSPKPTGDALRRADRTWESLFRAQVEVMRRLLADDAFESLSIREYDVLYNLVRCGGWIRQRELNAYLLMSQPSLSRMLERLVERGWVERRRAAEDARGVQVRLTDAGVSVQRRVGAAHRRSIERALSAALSAEEMDQLARLTEQLRESVREGSRGPDRDAEPDTDPETGTSSGAGTG